MWILNLIILFNLIVISDAKLKQNINQSSKNQSSNSKKVQVVKKQNSILNYKLEPNALRDLCIYMHMELAMNSFISIQRLEESKKHHNANLEKINTEIKKIKSDLRLSGNILDSLFFSSGFYPGEQVVEMFNSLDIVKNFNNIFLSQYHGNAAVHKYTIYVEKLFRKTFNLTPEYWSSDEIRKIFYSTYLSNDLYNIYSGLKSYADHERSMRTSFDIYSPRIVKDVLVISDLDYSSSDLVLSALKRFNKTVNRVMSIELEENYNQALMNARDIKYLLSKLNFSKIEKHMKEFKNFKLLLPKNPEIEKIAEKIIALGLDKALNELCKTILIHKKLLIQNG